MKNILKNISLSRSLPLLLGMWMMGLFFFSCENNPSSPSLYNPNNTGGPTPTLTSISPPDSALSGVSSITLTGTNFSTSNSENLVFFNTKQATVLQSSATQLVVRAPVLTSDTVFVKVAVFRSAAYSNSLPYKLKDAVSSFGNLTNVEEPYGLACDSSGNLYASLTISGSGIGIKKFTPAGVRSDYVPGSQTTGITFYSALKMGPGGILYAARGLGVIYEIPAGGGIPVIWKNTGGIAITDFDFDSQLNIWGGGESNTICCIKPDKTQLDFPFTGIIRSVRVYNNYLYVAATIDTSSSIVRFPIQAGPNLGNQETYFDFVNYTSPKAVPYTITFNSDGDMYMGTDSQDGMILVRPGGAWQAYYPGLFSPQPYSFAWGKGAELYVSRTGLTASHIIIKVNTLKQSAPYFGRGN